MGDPGRVGHIFADWLSAIDDSAGGEDSEEFLQELLSSTDASERIDVSVEQLPVNAE